MAQTIGPFFILSYQWQWQFPQKNGRIDSRVCPGGTRCTAITPALQLQSVVRYAPSVLGKVVDKFIAPLLLLRNMGHN
jgi:hypothetical protein